MHVIILATWQKLIATVEVSNIVESLEDFKKESITMKRVGYIYQDICSIKNIQQAIMNASKGKKNRRVVRNIVEHEEQAANEIRAILLSTSYKPKPYHKFIIKDGPSKKERTIYCPAFYPDQIIHWAIMQVIEPIMMKGMYEFSCGSIPGRGIHYGKRYIERWLHRDRKNTKYCLKLDVKKYYPHIDNSVLKAKFREKIKDEEALRLIDTIIDSHAEGLPIGNYTSQWWANFYLEGLDHYIKENLHIKYYLRYMDDMVLFSSNKKRTSPGAKAHSGIYRADGLNTERKLAGFPNKLPSNRFLRV